jgi:hypothetical protein
MPVSSMYSPDYVLQGFYEISTKLGLNKLINLKCDSMRVVATIPIMDYYEEEFFCILNDGTFDDDLFDDFEELCQDIIESEEFIKYKLQLLL